MCSGVRKSGWPMPRLMMSRPWAASCVARARTANAFSSPMRSKAAMVLSIVAPQNECRSFCFAPQPRAGHPINFAAEFSPSASQNQMFRGAAPHGLGIAILDRIDRNNALFPAGRSWQCRAHLIIGRLSPMTSLGPSVADKRRTFRSLHESGCFVIPNPWNVGTARYLQGQGFKALATTSSGFAHAQGFADGAMPRDSVLTHLREISG